MNLMQALRTAFIAAAIAAIACTVARAYPSALTLKLYAQNRPGETGTATLSQIPGGVKIVIKLPGGQNGTQPVHIHTGSCAKLNPLPKYTLTNIVDGSSTTTISGINLGDLLEGNYVIDVHESSADTERYVACAPIAIPVAG
jgi:Cu/Zn superoxide dismutase